LVGKQFDQEFLNHLVHKAEENISFKIRYITVSPEELTEYLPEKTKSLLVWTSEDAAVLHS